VSFVADHIIKEWDRPCDRCGHSPVFANYAVIGRARDPEAYTEKLEEGRQEEVKAGYVSQHVIDGLVCLFISWTCPNATCQQDANRPPLEKLALQAKD
jgi:hypothetical protein